MQIYNMKFSSKMKLLFIVLFTALVMPASTYAAEYYLILSKRGTGLERIKISSLDECEDLGAQWSEVSNGHTFICLARE